MDGCIIATGWLTGSVTHSRCRLLIGVVDRFIHSIDRWSSRQRFRREKRANRRSMADRTYLGRGARRRRRSGSWRRLAPGRGKCSSRRSGWTAPRWRRRRTPWPTCKAAMPQEADPCFVCKLQYFLFFSFSFPFCCSSHNLFVKELGLISNKKQPQIKHTRWNWIILARQLVQLSETDEASRILCDVGYSSKELPKCWWVAWTLACDHLVKTSSTVSVGLTQPFTWCTLMMEYIYYYMIHGWMDLLNCTWCLSCCIISFQCELLITLASSVVLFDHPS